jgi:hypothetical protein
MTLTALAPTIPEELVTRLEVYPWSGSRFGVVSLLDVLRYAAEDFWKACELLTLLAGEPLVLSHPNGRKNAFAALNQLLAHCGKLKIKVSLKEAEKMLPVFNSPDPDPETIRILAARLSSVIHSELDSELFFQMEPTRLEYWGTDWLLGSPIYHAFPMAHEEIQSAGRCYAYGEPVACVFHLMRVIDAGLRSVADSLNIPYNARNWSGIADKLQSNMEEKYKNKTDDWKQKEPFYASILTDIQSISRAHRNPVLHEVEKKYTDADAFYLLTVTERFMGHLAENGMKEKP